MPIAIYDFTTGLDFSALANATGADHNNLVDQAVPYATDKGIVMVSTDTALNTPDVPNPNTSASYTKWKNYIWVRRVHSTATDTTPLSYTWNENAVSHATYLKWVRIPADTSALEALIDALDLRVDDLEASMATALATANAANATANLASTNASSALATANTANTNATTALSDLNTPTTGVKDRVTALETDVAAVETTTVSLQTQINTINTSLTTGFGPVFITPVTVFSSGAGVAYTTYDAAELLPSNARAIILEASADGITVSTSALTVRKDASSGDLIALKWGNNDAARPFYGVNQGVYPTTAAQTFDYAYGGAGGGTITLKVVGYII